MEDLLEKVKKKIYPVFTEVQDIPYQIPYSNKQSYDLTNLHVGQRKLFMNELQFLTKFLKSNNDMCYVIYAGAAPSNHIYLLHELFPKIKFILVDPNPFNIYLSGPKITHLNTSNDKVVYVRSKPKDHGQYLKFENTKQYTTFIKESKYNFYIIQDLYTNTLSEEFSSLDPVYFWSDIRTATNDLDIIWNLSQQYNWVRILKPKSCMLKFRCPYYNEFSDLKIINEKVKSFDDSLQISKIEYKLDFVQNFIDKKLIYFKGQVMIQPWGPVHTTEVRLVCSDLEQLEEYSCLVAEEKFMYYNNIDRTFVKHTNKHSNKKYGFDHCNDCSLESLIWTQYKEKYNIKAPVIYFVLRLMNVLGRPLKVKGHGLLF